MTPEIPSAERAEKLRKAVVAKYQEVSVSPAGHFSYPIGAESALTLGYPSSLLERIPRPVLDRFVGVGNPFSIRRPREGYVVLDAGCGCGLDTFVAAQLAGASGRAVGIDLTAEMVQVAQAASEHFAVGNTEFRVAFIEHLPFEDGCFDLVISNGVLNLIPDKRSAFHELARVLRPEGSLVAADLLLNGDIPKAIADGIDAWST